MDLAARRRDEIIAEVASAISFALQLEGVPHFLHLPTELNDGVAYIGDKEQDFESTDVSQLRPERWDCLLGHADEDGSSPFGLFRVFEEEGRVRQMPVREPSEVARIIKEQL